MNTNSLLDNVYNMVSKANNNLVHIWTTQIVFSWRWWFGVILAILPWIVWVKIRDKKDTYKLLFVGLIVMIVTATMDNIGISFHLWYYDWKVTPFVDIFIPWDYTLFPVAIMLTLQFIPNLNVYIKALLFSFLSAFIIEPFFSYIAIYDMVHWKHLYSFIIYIPLYLFFNYIYQSKLLKRH